MEHSQTKTTGKVAVISARQELGQDLGQELGQELGQDLGPVLTNNAPPRTPRKPRNPRTVGHVTGNVDQREQRRFTSLFRPCCVEFDGQPYLAVIKNISPGGAQLSTDRPLSVGDVITYYWDSRHRLSGEVVWQRDGNVGVKNVEICEDVCALQPTRSVRIPCEILATMWVDGEAKPCLVSNISLKGLCAFGVEGVDKGKMVTVVIGKFAFQSAIVRWSAYGSVGLVFAQPIRLEQMQELLCAHREMGAA